MGNLHDDNLFNEGDWPYGRCAVHDLTVGALRLMKKHPQYFLAHLDTYATKLSNAQQLERYISKAMLNSMMLNPLIPLKDFSGRKRTLKYEKELNNRL